MTGVVHGRLARGLREKKRKIKLMDANNQVVIARGRGRSGRRNRVWGNKW